MSSGDEQQQGYFAWFHDKLGDGLVACLDEAKFWTEVVAEYMEWDESSAQRIAQQYKQEMRDHIKEADDIAEAVKEQIDREEAEELRKVEEEN